MADVVWVEVKQQAQDGDPVNEWAIVVDNMVEHIKKPNRTRIATLPDYAWKSIPPLRARTRWRK